SRRRHTRLVSDWSSDVCSSDLRTFVWQVSADGKIGTITLNRPERKNPLTFGSYAELRDLFRALVYATDIKAVVVTGAGGNFCSEIGRASCRERVWVWGVGGAA